MTTCKNCGKPIEQFSPPSLKGLVPALQWRHDDGYYGCNKAKPSPSPTYAEPAEADDASL